MRREWFGWGKTLGEGGTDPWEESGSDFKGRSARKVGRRGAAEVVLGRWVVISGGWGIEIGVGIPAKLGGGWEKAWKYAEGTWKVSLHWGTGKGLLLGGISMLA